jgi:hypothetical protein
MIENEGWRVADEAADLLEVDREVCRRAFYQEPEERVREVVQWVLSQRRLLGYDTERVIESWACEHGAGVYGEKRWVGSLEHVEGIVIRILLRHDTAA